MQSCHAGRTLLDGSLGCIRMRNRRLSILCAKSELNLSHFLIVIVPHFIASPMFRYNL